MKLLVFIISISFLGISFTYSQDSQGIYFPKKEFVKHPLPKFEETKSKLPSPIFDEDTSFVSCYWKAWQIAFKNMYEPVEGSGFVSQYIDASFNNNIFLWDMSFITMFSRYATPYVPAISSMDNFYSRQHADGEICREIDRVTGQDFIMWQNPEKESLFSMWMLGIGSLIKSPITYVDREIPAPPPVLTLDALNHPILCWAELESYQITGDMSRLAIVWEPLLHYYEALKKYLRQGNGLYITDWASMDNSPRNNYIINGGTTVDISSEMVLFARGMATMAELINKIDDAKYFIQEADILSQIINEKMWNEKDKFYYDLTVTGQYIPVKTIGSFWPLISGVCDSLQATFLSSELENKETFNRAHNVPTLAANHKEFNPRGGYWMGAVWAPTNTMIIKGLEKYGYKNQARDIAMNHLRNVIAVYKETGTIWENYSADYVTPGDVAKAEFVGWSGIAPISYFFEYAIGIKANAPDKTIEWTITSLDNVGIEKFWFGGITTDLMCSKPDAKGNRKIKVTSDSNYTLKILYNGNEIIKKVKKGVSTTIKL